MGVKVPQCPSGIDAVGPLPWGTHFCQFYQERQDLLDTLVPYFAAGLNNDEACMWVTSDPLTVADVTAALRERVPDLDDRTASGQLEVIAHADWYRQGDVFDARRVLQHWVDRQSRALDRGFKGFRLTGNTAWLVRSGWDDFVEYEALVNSSFGQYRIIALCTYCLGRCCAGDVLDVVRNHEFALTRRGGRWDLLESSSLKAAKAELARANEQLELRVRERTAELQAATAAAEAANRAKDHFLAVLSHELRTPLTPVLAAVGHLERSGQVAPEGGDDLAVIRRNVELEARLIDDLLDLTRIDRGRLELRQEVVDLRQTVRDALSVCQAECDAKGLEVAVAMRAAKHEVWADPSRLQQVFWNLISNAAKFTPAGGRVAISSSDAGDGRVLVRVDDSGSGIEASALGRIFNAFEQGEQSLRRRHGGLGLGLTVAKAVVELHGGTITAASAGPGRGATFAVELPTLADPARGRRVAAPDAPADRAEPARRRRILLVEDHADTARMLSRLLRSAGHEVRHAGTVSAALAAAKQGGLDLLISDIGLPDGTGIDLLKQLPAELRSRAIAVSGFGTAEDIAQSRDAGFATHLTKPLSIDALLSTIDRVALQARPVP